VLYFTINFPALLCISANKLSQHLLGKHQIYLECRSLIVDVEDILVQPQPFGALLSLILDERGKLVTNATERVEGWVGILDIGQHTTDMILVEGLEYMEARSGSIEAEVSTATWSARC
jgi:plasmid segregation protein ParM